MTRKADLRSVAPGERPAAPVKELTLEEAAEKGTHRDLLVAMRTRLAKATQSASCPPRDLAALSRRLQEVAREIEEIDARSGDDLTEAAATADDDFDANAL